MNHDPFLQRAIELSRQLELGGPFGAVVVRDDRIIAEGCNQVVAANDPTAHAELVAIRAACQRLGSFRLEGCHLYVSCEPCPMCLAAIYWARLAAVTYAATREDAASAGFDDARIYREMSRPVHDRSLPMTQLMRNDALVAFDEWRSKPDRVPY